MREQLLRRQSLLHQSRTANQSLDNQTQKTLYNALATIKDQGWPLSRVKPEVHYNLKMRVFIMCFPKPGRHEAFERILLYKQTQQGIFLFRVDCNVAGVVDLPSTRRSPVEKGPRKVGRCHRQLFQQNPTSGPLIQFRARLQLFEKLCFLSACLLVRSNLSQFLLMLWESEAILSVEGHLKLALRFLHWLLSHFFLQEHLPLSHSQRNSPGIICHQGPLTVFSCQIQTGFLFV